MGRLSKKITKEDVEKMTVEELIELKKKIYYSSYISVNEIFVITGCSEPKIYADTRKWKDHPEFAPLGKPLLDQYGWGYSKNEVVQTYRLQSNYEEITGKKFKPERN